FTRKGGADIAGNQEVIAAAFSPALIQDGENSKPIRLDAQHLVVVRKAEYEAPRQLSQAEVADQIRSELRDETAKAKAAAAAAALLKSVDEGQTFEAATKAAGLSPIAPGTVQRDNKDLPPALVGAVFKLPRPAGSKLVYSQAPLDGGDIAVIALSAVNDPQPQSTDQDSIRTSTTQLRNARAGAEMAAYRDVVEKQVKVNIKATPATSDVDQGN
ncbi:MAG TPA: hypothetical protein VNX47_09595, partial [Nevskia sp.]|nr:hypothetical protein [Nevskia sp.]